MTLNEIPIYVVNLKERIELTESLKSKLDSFGVLDNTLFLDATRFDLLENDDKVFWNNIYSDRFQYWGYQLVLGCLSSHYEVWNKIKDSQKDYSLVFEEDVQFEDNFINEFNNIKIPNEFDILFLGGTFEQTEKDGSLYIPDFSNKNAFTTEAYILSKNGANKLIDYIDKENDFYEDNVIKYKVKSINPIDWYIHNIAKKGLLSCYAISPLICYQPKFR